MAKKTDRTSTKKKKTKKPTTKKASSPKKPKEKKEPLFFLSVSRVNLFEQCNAKYYYRYILKLPDRSTYQSATGTFLHKALELFVAEYLKENNLRSAAQKAYVAAKKHPELDEVRELITPEMADEVKGWLKDYVKLFEEHPDKMPSFLQAETRFRFQIEKTKFVVQGFIDRIDQTPDNSIRVVDYKTTSNAAYLDPFQLVVYTIPAKEMFPGKTIQASYELARQNFEQKSYEITDADRQAAIDKIVKVGTQIQELTAKNDSSAWKPSPSYLCNYCPYRVQCDKDHSSGWSK